METVYSVLFYGGLTLAIIFAIIAVVLFFVLKIPKAVGDVTGSTARRQIEEIRQKGYESVQGGGASKQEAIKSHTSKISVRDIQSVTSTRQAEKGKANYEKAIAELEMQRREEATDILHEGVNDIPEEDDTTDIIVAPFPNKKEAAIKEMRTQEMRRQSSNAAPTAVHMAGVSDSESATDVLRADTLDTEGEMDILEVDRQTLAYAVKDSSESATDVLRGVDEGEEATDVLRAGDEGEEATDVLRTDDDEAATDVLREDDSDAPTDVLHEGRSTGNVRVIKSIVVVHTDEKI